MLGAGKTMMAGTCDEIPDARLVEYTLAHILGELEAIDALLVPDENEELHMAGRSNLSAVRTRLLGVMARMDSMITLIKEGG